MGRCKLLRNFPNFPNDNGEERTYIATSQCVVIYNCRTSLDLLEVFYSPSAAIVFPFTFPGFILFEFFRSYIVSDQTRLFSQCELYGFGILFTSAHYVM